jgi:hypothetical protein
MNRSAALAEVVEQVLHVDRPDHVVDVPHRGTRV